MARFSPALAVDYWHAALKEEFGVRFSVTPETCQQIMKEMYEARKPYPALSDLSLRIIEDGTEIWLYRKEVQLED